MADASDLSQTFEDMLVELPEQHQAFVREYLRDLNGTKAALRAKYAASGAHVQASRLLRNAKVAAVVRIGLALKAMPADEVLARLAEYGRGDMADFLRVDEEDVILSLHVTVLSDQERARLELGGTEGMRQFLADSVTDGAEGADSKTPKAVLVQTSTIKRAVSRLDLLRASDKLHLIKKYTVDKDGKESIELYDAYAAVVKLGEHHKLFGKTDDVLKYIDLSKLSPEQLSRIAKGEDPLAVLLAT